MNEIEKPREFRSIKDFAPTIIPRCGKIRLGIKKKSKRGNLYPSETDYFVFDPDLPGRAKLVEQFGEKPKRILVTFASSDIGTVFPQAYKMYGRSLGLVCRGNGEEAERVVIDRVDGKPRKRKDANGKTMIEVLKCPCEFLGGDRPKCRPIGNLMVVVPSVSWQAYQIDTSSYHTMKDIASELNHFNATLAGGVRGKLFWLTREPKDTFESGSKNTHYTLHLRLPEPEEYEAALNAIRERMAAYDSLMPNALPDAQYETPAQLPAGHPIEEADVTAEPDLVDEEQLGEHVQEDDLLDGPPSGEEEEEGSEEAPKSEPENEETSASKSGITDDDDLTW
jgi:hypothetical protein